MQTQQENAQVQYKTETTIKEFQSNKIPSDISYNFEEIFKDIPKISETATIVEEPPPTGVNVGPVGIDYGSIWLDLLMGVAVLTAIGVGYLGKKLIDKKFK